MFVWVYWFVDVDYESRWKQKSSHERNKCLEKNSFRENTKTCPIIQWFLSATEDAIVSPVISTVNVCGRCNKKSTAMKDSWRLVVVDGPLIVSAECHKNWYRTFQGILKIWVCRKWEFQSRPATAIDHQCSCLTTFPLPICTHKLLLAQSKGTATWDRWRFPWRPVASLALVSLPVSWPSWPWLISYWGFEHRLGFSKRWGYDMRNDGWLIIDIIASGFCMFCGLWTVCSLYY